MLALTINNIFNPKKQSAHIEPPYKVIIMTIAGVRNKESIYDQHKQYMPFFLKQMIPRGTIFNNVYVNGYFSHLPAAMEINTGLVYPYYTQDMKIIAPSIFQYVKKQYNLPANKLWAVGFYTKDASEHLTLKMDEKTFPSQITAGNGGNLTFPTFLKEILSKEELYTFEKFPEHVPANKWLSWDSHSAMLFPVFKKILTTYKPALAHYSMMAVESAHYGTYGNYVIGLRDEDERIHEVWTMIQNDEYYRDKTYLFVVCDGGRDENYYMQHEPHGHWNNKNEDPWISDDPQRITWMYVFGPGVKPGTIINRQVYHFDIFATVAKIFNVQTHATQGVVLRELEFD